MSLQFHSGFPTSGDFSAFGRPQLFRLFDDLEVGQTGHRRPKNRPFNPRFDVRESEDAYHLDGELPGIAQKDIDMQFSDPQTLVVKGRTEREYHRTKPNATEVAKADASDDSSASEETKSHHYWASERTVGEFQRTFSFPSRVDQDAVKASLKNGVLSVTIPKVTAQATKKITIE